VVSGAGLRGRNGPDVAAGEPGAERSNYDEGRLRVGMGLDLGKPDGLAGRQKGQRRLARSKKGRDAITRGVLRAQSSEPPHAKQYSNP
jgi:hypothetical protein